MAGRCPVCDGEGAVLVAERVSPSGRRARRSYALCLCCEGSGERGSA